MLLCILLYNEGEKNPWLRNEHLTKSIRNEEWMALRIANTRISKERADWD